MYPPRSCVVTTLLWNELEKKAELLYTARFSLYRGARSSQHDILEHRDDRGTLTDYRRVVIVKISSAAKRILQYESESATYQERA
jgi:hypothetical protein